MTRNPEDVAISNKANAHHSVGASDKEFLGWKNAALGKIDLSRKGSIDEEIHTLVSYINAQKDYFTTSSCSGRMLLCSDDIPNQGGDKIDTKPSIKKGCRWFFVSHQPFEVDSLLQAFDSINCATKYKFEPFVLHAQCRTLEKARLLHRAAVESGFRNSGISFGKSGRKIIAAVRGTLCLEVPVTNDKGERLTSEEYIRHIVDISHQKLANNFRMIKVFHENLTAAAEKYSLEPQRQANGKTVYRRKGKGPKELLPTADVNSYMKPINLFNEEDS